MSIASVSIVCSNCNFKVVKTSRPILLEYEIGGKVFETGRKYGWCFQCDSISDIEPEFNVNDIKSNIETLKQDLVLKKNFFSKLFNKSKYTEIETEISQLEIQLEIAQSRLSARRCLSCGCDQVEEISRFEGEIFKHKCGGSLSVIPESENDSPVRLLYKLEKIYLNKEGIRKDKASYPKQQKITESNEYILVDIYQQIIDAHYQIQEYFKDDFKCQVSEIDNDEIMFFTLTVLTYLILRFSNISSKEKLLDELATIVITDLNHAYIENYKDELINDYQDRYKEYTNIIELIFSPERSKTGNASITLALHLYEMVTKQSSKDKMQEVIYLSERISELVIEQIQYVKTKINQP